jgi:hypothetical protein
MVFPACTDVKLSFLLDVWQLDTPAEVPLELPTPPPPKKEDANKKSKAKNNPSVQCSDDLEPGLIVEEVCRSFARENPASLGCCSVTISRKVKCFRTFNSRKENALYLFPCCSGSVSLGGAVKLSASRVLHPPTIDAAMAQLDPIVMQNSSAKVRRVSKLQQGWHPCMLFAVNWFSPCFISNKIEPFSCWQVGAGKLQAQRRAPGLQEREDCV